MNPKPSTMTVDLGDRSYDILVGKGLLSEAGSLIQPLLDEPRVVVITDEIVEKQWLKPLISSLDAAGISHECIVLEAGEQTKDSFCRPPSRLKPTKKTNKNRSSRPRSLKSSMANRSMGFIPG